MNNPNFLEKNKHIILATLITSIILVIVFAFSGYYPFGDNSILKVDLYHQYAPFHEELRYKLLNGESLFYSWQGGLGKEFLSQIAYYTASPISILILFFPVKYLSEAILLFVFIKISLCATSFSYFLKNTNFNKSTSFDFDNNDAPLIILFSIMYAFIAFTTSFYWNIMWLDSIYLFPIVVLGVNKLVEHNEYKPYLYSLMLCIIVNFYIAFLVCVFITLYFLIKLFSDYSLKHDSKIILNKMFRFAILSLCAGGATMFLGIPTVEALTRTQTSDATFPSFEVYANVYQIISSHFSGVTPVVLARNEDLPNLYSGVLCMMLLPAYFFNNNIKLKEKALYLILIIFMLACSVFKQMDFIIHGLHFPANLPHRYTFIYSFIILMLAYKGAVNIKDGFNIKILYLFVIIYSLGLYYTEFILVDKIDDITQVLTPNDFSANIVLMLAYTILIVLYRYFNLNKNLEKINTSISDQNKKNNGFINFGAIVFVIASILIFKYAIINTSGYFNDYNMTDESANVIIPSSFYILSFLFIFACILIAYFIKKVFKDNRFNTSVVFMILLFIVSGESLFNATVGFLHSSSTSRTAYIQYLEPVDSVLAYIDNYEKATNSNNKFFRQEFNRFTAINESTMYHYNGFSMFSSLAYGDTSKLLEQVGIAATSNSYRYYDPTPLLDSMFNIKYVMTKSKFLDNYHYNFLTEFGQVGLYENRFPLSLGFMVDSSVKAWNTELETPFDIQNDFIQRAVSTELEILTPEVVENFTSVNVDITAKDGKTEDFTYTLHNESDLSAIPTVYANLVSSKAQRLYIYVEAPNARRFIYEINGHTNDRELSTGRSLIDLGFVEEGQVINIQFSLDRKGTYDKTYSKNGSFRVHSAGFEDDIYEMLYQDLEDEILIVEEYDSTYVKGIVTANQDGLLFTSIPYDRAFKAYVNGKEVPTLSIANNGLIGIDLSAGTHIVEFKYKPTSFTIGVILTLISILLIIIYSKYDKKTRLTSQSTTSSSEEDFITNLGTWVDNSNIDLSDLGDLNNLDDSDDLNSQDDSSNLDEDDDKN